MYALLLKMYIFAVAPFFFFPSDCPDFGRTVKSSFSVFVQLLLFERV